MTRQELGTKAQKTYHQVNQSGRTVQEDQYHCASSSALTESSQTGELNTRTNRTNWRNLGQKQMLENLTNPT
ncbi:hypothetical protein PG994_004389 [Apiospora phragmitis]|uniref:Uncharacterized protein n=1 Tax=Apiospora phragmitis TaxID=2905665 RepID=A0ABR1VTJ0_9PEZI